MTDDRTQPTMPDADPTDAAIEQIIPPEQPPMDDAAGGPAASDDDADSDSVDDVSTSDLSVQGGE